MKLWDKGRKELAPWDGAKQGKNVEPWDGAGWTDITASREAPEQKADFSALQEEQPSDTPKQADTSSPASEGDTSAGQERATSEGYGIRIAGAVMTLVSYTLLFRLPDEPAYIDYGVFFLSVLLFCVGFFWMVADFPEPVTPFGTILRNAGICTAAAALLSLGCGVISTRDGSEGSIYIGTVLLIQSLVSLMGLSSDWKERAGFAIRAVSMGLAVWGVWLFIRFIREEDAGDGLISAAVMLWIASIALYRMFGTGREERERGGRGKKKKSKKRT